MMNPHQQNKVDVSSLSPEEQRLFRLYGKLPNKKDLLQNKLKERKYFDSGDYALSKAGKASDIGVTSVGTSHPSPESIPHHAPSALSNTMTHSQPHNGSLGGASGASGAPVPNFQGHGHRGSIVGGKAGSPVKEGSVLRENSVDDVEEEEEGKKEGGKS
ncbi:Endosulfine-domain-containing protein [Eremomyces bilateralis CBS 781.70]|uniref:mRNA stability protein n=1 Tax=Eremomyces bilateralis CBS 781.70 TaxID=1392243 RepID=A0A6G1FZX6_9PEZI|nr:Endosulfine-domain-containing protein [Eremomyces bilateralis CBS 781.70]KAF1811119.1 Endosulfine-domain-containing protein [Eremomyces bilateralis CBS 781.70]